MEEQSMPPDATLTNRDTIKKLTYLERSTIQPGGILGGVQPFAPVPFGLDRDEEREEQREEQEQA
jgi:hypothetical protein